MSLLLLLHLHEHRAVSRALEQSFLAPFRRQESHSNHTSQETRASHSRASGRSAVRLLSCMEVGAPQSARNLQATSGIERKPQRYQRLLLALRGTALRRSDKSE